MKTVLPARRVGRRAEIGHGRGLAQHHEAVPQSFGKVDGPPVLIIQDDRVDSGERGRSDSKIHDDVEYPSSHAGHVLRLTRRDVREVDATQDAATGDRAVRRSQRECVPCLALEDIGAEPLQEHSAIVAMLSRRDLEGVGNGQRADLAGKEAHALAPPGPSRLIKSPPYPLLTRGSARAVISSALTYPLRQAVSSRHPSCNAGATRYANELGRVHHRLRAHAPAASVAGAQERLLGVRRGADK